MHKNPQEAASKVLRPPPYSTSLITGTSSHKMIFPPKKAKKRPESPQFDYWPGPRRQIRPGHKVLANTPSRTAVAGPVTSVTLPSVFSLNSSPHCLKA